MSKTRSPHFHSFAFAAAALFVAVVGCGTRESSPVGEATTVKAVKEFVDGATMLMEGTYALDSARYSFRFRLANTVTGTARVSILRKSCGCLDVRFERPGGEAIEEPRIAGMSDIYCVVSVPLAQHEGKHTAEILIQTEFDGGLREVSMLSGSILALHTIKLEPVALHWRKSRQSSQPVREKLVVRHRFDAKEALRCTLECSSNVPWLKLAEAKKIGLVREIAPSIMEEVLSVPVDCDTNVALRGSEMSFATASVSLQSRYGDKVRAMRACPVVVEQAEGLVAPSEVLFGPVKVGQSYRRRVPVRSADGTPFRLVKAKSDDDSVKVSVDPQDAPRTLAWLTVNLSPKTPSRTEADVTVDVDHPTQTSVKMRVLAGAE